MATHPDSPRALLIAGMHRSGTSAAALALARMGWSLGADQLETQSEINRDGFGENLGVVSLNEKLLTHFDSAWYHLFDWPQGWESSDEASAFLEEAERLLADQFAGEQQILLKDPRLCLTLPFWLRALERAGFATRVILQWRHPQAVAQSLERRDSLPQSAGLMLWLHYVLASERGSRGVERAWLRYEDLLAQGASALALFEDLPVTEAADTGIDGSLAHHATTEFAQSNALTEGCQSVVDAIESGGEPAGYLWQASLWQGMDAADLSALFNSFSSALTGRAAEAVSVGEQHSRALEVIAEKDEALEQSAAYARQCESVISEKDAAIEEVTTYAQQCEATVAEKDTQIAEANRYAGECEAVVQTRDAEIAEANSRIDAREAELNALRGQRVYRLLHKLRILR